MNSFPKGRVNLKRAVPAGNFISSRAESIRPSPAGRAGFSLSGEPMAEHPLNDIAVPFNPFLLLAPRDDQSTAVPCIRKRRMLYFFGMVCWIFGNLLDEVI